MDKENSLIPSPETKFQINMMVWMWTFCSLSPLIYFAVSWILLRYFFLDAGLFNLSESTTKNLFLSALPIIPAVQISIIWLYRKYQKLFLTAADETHLFNLLRKRNLWLLLLSELSGLTGFTLFLLSGNLQYMFVLGVYSLLCYAQCHPTRKQPFKIA